MTEQPHKRLIDEQVKMILDRFVKKEISSRQAMELLETVTIKNDKCLYSNSKVS